MASVGDAHKEALVRHRETLAAALEGRTAEELVPRRDPLVLPGTLSAVEGFSTLAEADIRSCPVSKEVGDRAFVGALDLRDACTFYVESARSRNEVQTIQASCAKARRASLELDTHMPAGDSILLDESRSPLRRPHKSGSLGEDRFPANELLLVASHHANVTKESSESTAYVARMRPFKVLAPCASFKEIAQCLSRGSHIVGIGGGPDEWSGLSKVLTQGLLFRTLAPLLEEIDTPVSAIMTTPVIAVPCEMSAFEAFETLASQSSGLAVVDDESLLRFSAGATDLKRWIRLKGDITAEHADELKDTSIAELLKTLQASEASAGEVAECTPDATISSVVQKLLTTGYHRVWVVESTERRVPAGVISMTDIFRKLVA